MLSTDLHYEGSLTVDEDLLDAAELLPNEEIHVVHHAGPARAGDHVGGESRAIVHVQLNGAAARLGQPGDVAILIAYGVFDEAEAERHVPRVVFVDEKNRAGRPPLRAER